MALYCSYCGTTLPNDAAFCFKCGRAVPRVDTSANVTPVQQISIDEMGITLPADEQILYRDELGDQVRYRKGSYLLLTRRRILIRWINDNRLEQIPAHYTRSISMQSANTYTHNQVLIDIGRKSQFHPDGVIRLFCKDKDQASEIAALAEQVMLQAGSADYFG